MLRKVLCLLVIGSALFLGGCAGEEFLNVAGTWQMVANVDFNFDLVLTQDGDTISGTMTRTNGVETVDNVRGTIDSDDVIVFTRVREGAGGWTQTFTGVVGSSNGAATTMAGTLTASWTTEVVTWSATKN